MSFEDGIDISWWEGQPEELRPDKGRYIMVQRLMKQNVEKEKRARARNISFDQAAIIQQRINILASMILNPDGVLEFDHQFGQFMAGMLDQALASSPLVIGHPTDLGKLRGLNGGQ